jgi:hypothetical protein
MQSVPFEVKGDLYAGIYIQKSSNYITYQRQFNKIDNLFSYIGGLIGGIIGLMFIAQNYTDASYEIDIGDNLYSTN